MRQKLASITQKLRLPAICSLCNQFHRDKFPVCTYCIQFISPLGAVCPRCAHPLPDQHAALCGHCLKNPKHFNKVWVGYVFEEPLRSLLHQFKYHKGLYLKNFLCMLMLEALKEKTKPSQCLIPVPMHSDRLKKRGFNHAAVLTRYLAKQLQMPYNLHACRKILNTAPQAALDSKQRQHNLKHAFYCDPLPYTHVTLVDDLMTTGCTANEVALSLLSAGVRQVDIWCCAKAVLIGK